MLEVMSMKRLNITLSEEIVEEIKDVPNKSRFIAEALKEKLEKMKKEIIKLEPKVRNVKQQKRRIRM